MTEAEKHVRRRARHRCEYCNMHKASGGRGFPSWDKIPILSWLNPSKYKTTRLESCPMIGGRFASLPEPGRPEGGPNTDRACPTGLVDVAGEVIPAGRLKKAPTSPESIR
jgi:hypothetical protein